MHCKICGKRPFLMQNWNSKIHPEAPHVHCACIRMESAGNTTWRDPNPGYLTGPIPKCAHDQTVALNFNRNLQAVGATWGCLSSFYATVPECQRSSSETSKAAASEPRFDHLRSEGWDSRILIQAHWERSFPGPRDSHKSFSQPNEDNLPSSTFYAPDHQLSQRIYCHEGLHHCQVNERPTFGKIQKASAGYSTPLPTIPGSHLVKTNVTQNASSHSLRRPQSSLTNVLPTGSSCENSVEAGHIALATLVRLRALLAQCCHSLNSLFEVHQDVICCRHYYASAVVCWLFCIVITTVVLIAATAFRSPHNGD
ncbi:uncharacterized protein LOC118224838 isoform X2 [Anguilla anguilla]|uniref:uncharacterized protein LOC118224838 isoform X2 n=1 Tax=Anguilla anguilla TaxID=7936 RepID=UPI0015ABDB01|nr:uncharacterized protein LOC118224838 isoform X2 [Anguilla anguilla]